MATNPIQVQKFLSGIDYPCSKDDLVQHAEQSGADQSVLETLRSLPQDTFDTPKQVSQAIGDEE